MAFPVISPLPTAPNPNDPASFDAQAYPFAAALGPFGVQLNAFGTAMNNYEAGGVPFVGSVGGSANALTISLPERDAALTKMFFFAPASSNTLTSVTINLNGEGAKAIETPRGTNPPVGYLGYNGTGGVPFMATRSTTGWVVLRPDEYGTNANGEYWKMGSGLLICRHAPTSASLAISTGFQGGFRSDDQIWSFPYAFAGVPAFNPREVNGTSFGVAGWTLTAASAAYAFKAITSQSAAAREVSLTAEGRWY